jgi:protein-S-isoprenylcysteine O-methyltransferase Ste14
MSDASPDRAADSSAAAPRARTPMDSAVFRAAASLISTAIDALLLVPALGGFAALAAHTRALALLAIWAVLGMFLAVARPVRPAKPVAADADARWMFAALGIVPMLVAPVAALCERFGVLPLPGGDALRWGGVALSGLGLALRIAAMMQLGSRFAPIAAVQQEHALETRGLYSRMRHPGYLGSWLTAIGSACAFGSALGLLLPLAMLPMFYSRIRREERLLARHFGERFTEWRSRTGGLLPKLF